MADRMQTALAALDTNRRLELARSRLEKVVDRARALVALHENNSIVTYSDRLSRQIPASYAGHAFTVFQNALFNQEIVMLSSLWDRPDDTFNHQSIPTVCAPIDDPATLAANSDVVRKWHDPKALEIVSGESSPLTEEEYRSALSGYFAELRGEDVAAAQSGLATAIHEVHEIERSNLLTSVRNIRDKHLAHGLENTRAEGRGAITPMKYGDERTLLERTLPIIEKLHQFINGAGFEFAQTARIQRRYAEELWSNCLFEIPLYPSPDTARE